MNMSEVITRIKMDLGLMAIATPFENINDTINEIICVKTLPVFSIYLPHRVDGIKIHLKSLVRIGRFPDEEEYILPNFDNNLLYIYDVSYANSDMTSSLGAAVADYPLVTSGVTNAYLQSNALLSVTREMIPRMSFEFIKPNRIKIWNRYYQDYIALDVGFEHSPSLATIPDSAKESFIELARLDVKSVLYESMKLYTGLSTAYGRVDLKLDSWESAASERRDLLEKWDSSFHLEQDAFYYG